MQRISLDHLRKLITEGTFMPPPSEGTPELSGTTAILLVFQADGQHEKITDVYMGLRVKSRLYTPDQILDFVRDIEGDLQVAWDALKAGGNPGKRRAFFLFVSNYGGAMSVPMDPPYCLVYPTTYVGDVEPDHFNTHNNLAGTHLHHCICCTMLQFTNDDSDQCRKYSGSHLILPCRAQYNDRLFPTILEPQNHWEPLMDSSTKEPISMELVGDFQAADPIFKGCYGGMTHRQWEIHLPVYRGEIPVPPAPLYWQARVPKVTKQSPPRAATPNPSMESPKTKHSSGKGSPHCSSGCNSNTSTPKHPDSTSARKPSSSKEPTLNSQEKSHRAHGSRKHSCSPSPSTKSVGHKWKDVCSEDSCMLNSTLPVSSSMFDSLCSPIGSHSNVTELLPPSITSASLGLAGPRQW